MDNLYQSTGLVTYAKKVSQVSQYIPWDVSLNTNVNPDSFICNYVM